MPRLVVIDAANALYRAFFALPPLRSPSGVATGAVFGFANMLRKLVREEKPDAIAVAMDPRGGSFRRELYPEYKATRDAQPEDLSAQLPLARELIDAWKLPVLEVKGFEADDVIATLATTAPAGWEVVIVSSDKDLMQLVGGRVVLYDGMKDKRIGPAEVTERFGVGPEKLLDVRALVGDSSDNIPGVKGIGEKGAAALITEYGTLENLLAHASDVKAKKAREALLAQADAARLSKQLATLRTDVPLPLGVDALAPHAPDRAALRELYKRLGFARLVEEIDAELAGAAQNGARADASKAVPAVAAGHAPVSCDVLRDFAALRAAITSLASAERVAIVLVGDTEPGGMPAVPAGIALCGDPSRTFYLPLAHDLLGGAQLAWSEASAELFALFAGPAPRPWVASDTKRVQSLLAEAGGEAKLPALDVQLAAFLLDPAGASTTQALAQQLSGRELRTFEDLAGRGAKARPASTLSAEEAGGWAAEEASALLALAPVIEQRIRADELEPLLRDIELPLTAVLSAMERAGVRIDEAKLAALSKQYEADLARIEGEIYALAGERFQINSPKQLATVLFEKLKLPAVKKTKTGFSTDESVLEQLAPQHALPAAILAWRKLAKLRSTYVDALPPLVNARTGRIHPTFNQIGAATGRLSSTHPNVQNIPIRSEEGIRIREAFIPAEGMKLLSADYSQVELRIVAHYSGDESLIDAFAKGEDIHRRTAAEVAGIDPSEVSADQRAHAKAINFGIIYGSSAFGIANQLGIAQAEAQDTINRYFARYRGVRRFLDETIAAASEAGYVRTLLGRRRYLPDLRSRNRALRQAAERMAVNTVIQGTAADLIKKAMVEVQQALHDAGLRARMLLQVHDELVFEAPERELGELTALVKKHMGGVYALSVPLVADVGVGKNWREAH
ncbi:MAG: DNA polymerase I [Deltaproteobacteria bacterium]|nr:DNA polymerase I [Deltaproteobacteria bacterium]